MILSIISILWIPSAFVHAICTSNTRFIKYLFLLFFCIRSLYFLFGDLHFPYPGDGEALYLAVAGTCEYIYNSICLSVQGSNLFFRFDPISSFLLWSLPTAYFYSLVLFRGLSRCNSFRNIEAFTNHLSVATGFTCIVYFANFFFRDFIYIGLFSVLILLIEYIHRNLFIKNQSSLFLSFEFTSLLSFLASTVFMVRHDVTFIIIFFSLLVSLLLPVLLKSLSLLFSFKIKPFQIFIAFSTALGLSLFLSILDFDSFLAAIDAFSNLNIVSRGFWGSYLAILLGPTPARSLFPAIFYQQTHLIHDSLAFVLNSLWLLLIFVPFLLNFSRNLFLRLFSYILNTSFVIRFCIVCICVYISIYSIVYSSVHFRKRVVIYSIGSIAISRAFKQPSHSFYP